MQEAEIGDRVYLEIDSTESKNNKMEGSITHYKLTGCDAQKSFTGNRFKQSFYTSTEMLLADEADVKKMTKQEKAKRDVGQYSSSIKPDGIFRSR